MNISVDLSAWQTMHPLLEWQHASAHGDFVALCRLMAQVVTGWELESNPQDADSYASLSPAQWAQCVKEVSNAIGALFRA